MERKEIVSRLGMGRRVVIVRSRFFHKGTTVMRLQVLGRRGWRTVAAVRMPEMEATQHRAREWLNNYNENPASTPGGLPNG